MGTDVKIGDHDILERQADLKDVLDALSFMAEVHVEGQKGRHGLFFDGSYFNLGDDDHRFQLGGPADGELVISGDLELAIVDLGGVFNPQGNGSGLTVFYGARVLDVALDLDAHFNFGPGSTPGRRYSAGTTFVDGLLGFRFIGSLSERWAYVLRADASAGGTEFTWNGWAGFGVAIGAAKRQEFLFGYRFMEIQYKEEDPRVDIEAQNTLSGFITGLKFGF